MADVRPLAAVRYAPSGDVSALIAPPYDVLDAGDKAALLAANDRNVVAIDLPHTPPKALGPDAVYERAGDTYRAWLADGTLARDPAPALYPYGQRYDGPTGATHHRRGFIALVRLTPFGRDVIPHELTHAGPIEDRLRLMHATRAQLSPIFGLFDDPDGSLTDLLHRDARPPDLDGRLDGVRNHLWTVDDPDPIAEVARRMADRKIYVADGHHRYTTALAYRRQIAGANGGTLPHDHPANFCMFVLVAMQDPGLTIRGYHRLIGGLTPDLTADALRGALAGTFAVEPTDLAPDSAALLEAPGMIGLYLAADRRTYRLRPDAPAVGDAMARLAPDASPAWRALDTAVLQRLLLDEVIAPRFAPAGLTKGYTADPASVPDRVDGGEHQAAFLLRPTPLSALRELGETGEVMPQKSTYFAPKVATGLAIYPLE